MFLKVIKLVPFANLPSKAYPGDLGFDLFSAEDCHIPPGGQVAVGSGVSVELPSGWGGILKDRSSMAIKRIYVSAGVIDNGYRGEIKAVLRNGSDKPYKIAKGDKITQMVLVPVPDVEIHEAPALESSERDSSGFGSTGS